MSLLLAFLITFALGLVKFFVWAHIIYKTDTLRKFPVGILDSIGDTILLPGFNAFAVYYGVLQQLFSMYHLLVSLVLGLLVLLIFIFEVRKEMQDRDWSLPRIEEFNAGGCIMPFLCYWMQLSYSTRCRQYRTDPTLGDTWSIPSVVWNSYHKRTNCVV